MKTSDLSPDRQKLLVPLKEYPGASALVPPPPKTLISTSNVRSDALPAPTP